MPRLTSYNSRLYFYIVSMPQLSSYVGGRLQVLSERSLFFKILNQIHFLPSIPKRPSDFPYTVFPTIIRPNQSFCFSVDRGETYLDLPPVSFDTRSNTSISHLMDDV